MRQVETDTGSTPEALRTKPPLSSGGMALLQAFNILDSARQLYEGGPQALPVSEVLAYLEIAKVDGVEDRMLFLNMVKTLDVIYLNHYAEQKK